MQDSVSRSATTLADTSLAQTPSSEGQAGHRERGWLAWAIRQTLIGMLILSALMGTWAWLTYQGIDFDQDAGPALSAPAPEEAPARQ